MKTYVPANAAQIRDDFLTDLRLAAIEAGVAEPPVHEGTDWHLLGTAIGEMGLGQYANIRIGEERTNILDAVGDDLKRESQALGLPELEPSKASGRLRVEVVSGTATFQAGALAVLPNGKTVQVVARQTVVNGGEVDVEATEAGTSGNAKGGTVASWLSPPVNAKSAATVSTSAPLTLGLDAESDDHRRKRILNKLQNSPAGGNWAHIRELGLNASPAFRDVFVYPALGGPASCKVVPVKAFDAVNGDWSPVPTTAQMQTLRAALGAELSDSVEIVKQAPAAVDLNATLLVTVPNAKAAGGDGNGWTDQTVWPLLEIADAGVVTVSAVTSPTQVTVTAQTATPPTGAQSHVMWWSTLDQKFHVRTVLSSSGSSGAWALTFDAPLTDSAGFGPAVGDYISPALVHADKYRSTWLAIAESFGPSENTADPNRLPRALRHPLAATEQGPTMTQAQLTAFQSAHAEVSDLAWGVTSALAVPAAVLSAPEVFRPARFGIYRK